MQQHSANGGPPHSIGLKLREHLHTLKVDMWLLRQLSEKNPEELPKAIAKIITRQEEQITRMSALLNSIDVDECFLRASAQHTQKISHFPSRHTRLMCQQKGKVTHEPPQP